MKLMLAILLILCSGCVFAQEAAKSSVKSGLTLSEVISLKKGSKPVIVIDGAIYKGELSSIKADDVLQVSVWDGEGAVNVYGKLAKDGAVLLTMKKGASRENEKILPDFSIVLNDVVVDTNIIKTIDPNSIAWITVLKNEGPNDHITPTRGKGVIVYTKDYIQKANRGKLINHSMAYGAYIKKDPDIKIKYLLDGSEIDLQDSQKLFELADDKFKSITLEFPIGENPANLKITTISQP